ncbi:SHOCT domain-containing protein [Clostridium lundense]|uniref:SHOCT domain-containing protein n=1 Tax=Clostridium lundense TaxID=319475 RepID=UPI0004824A10|nr:PH domain-containing protein [Clostridium lundense]
MGFFDLKAVCGVCGKEVGWNRFKIKRSNAWICSECLKKAGGAMSVDVSKVTIEDIKQMIPLDELEQYRDPLSTAEGMYQYCNDNKFDSGCNKKFMLRHFKIIEDNLLDDEKVYVTFVGVHNYVSATKHDGNYAYAITSKRIIIVQEDIDIIEEETLQSISLEDINNITLKLGMVLGTITVDTIKGIFNITSDKTAVKLINSRINEAINEINNDNSDNDNERLGSDTVVSVADELIKFKELLDMGVLTQEEFDAKKEQLLNL